jgi:hypothetical protein
LVLYNDTTDSTATFLSWRTAIDGIASSSNFYLLDTAITADRARLTALEALKIIIPVAAIYASGSTFNATGVTGIASYVDGTIIALKLDTTSPGTTQLNVNSLGLRSLVKIDTTGAQVNLTTGDLVLNRTYFFKYIISTTSWLWIAASSADQVNIAGTSGNVVTVSATNTLDGSLTQSLMISQTVHSAGGKVTPVDTDEIALVDSADSNKLKRVTWANVKVVLSSSLGAIIAAAGNKAIPVGGDLLGIADSASTNATKNITITQLFAQLGLLVHAFSAKTTIIGTDETNISDSAASFAGKRITWQNVAASWGVLIDGLSAKNPPVDADEFEIADSVASFVTKKLTWANLKATLKTYLDTLYNPVSAWNEVSGTWTYASASTITVPTDATTIYQKGDYLRWKQGGGYKYGTILTVAATLITIIVNTDYTVANSAITNVAYSRLSNPQGWPGKFNYLPVYSGETGGTPIVTTTSAIFRTFGTQMTIYLDCTITNVNGATGAFQYTSPVNYASVLTIGNGKEVALNGSSLQGYINSSNVMAMKTYNGSQVLVLNYHNIMVMPLEW